MSETGIIDYGNGIYALDQGMVRMFLIVGNDRAILPAPSLSLTERTG